MPAEDSNHDTKCVHLLVLIHGMWGNPRHLAEVRRIMDEKRCQADSDKGPDGERLRILVAETNRDDGTYDGIDWGGERVAEEIYEKVKTLEKEGQKVTRFSVTGYSLGGLIARYVVGILHQRGFFENVIPVNFNTLATPHAGLPRYPTFLSSAANFFGPRLLSRTGEQFFVVDKWSKNGRPLLEVMADSNRIFFQALELFQHVRIYANAVNDVTVPYPTAAIEKEDIFIDHMVNGMHIELDEQYSPIIKSYTPGPADLQIEKPRPFSVQWLKSFKPARPMLPPALQFKFPWNVAIVAISPVVLPLVFCLIITRLSLASRASRARIKLLEKDESNTERLVHVIGRLEREMEGVMLDMFDASGTPESPQPQEEGETPSPAEVDLAAASKQLGDKQPRLVFSETQLKIVAALNKLPVLKKELVYIHPVRNAHAVIISRDVQRFSSHKQGEGVIRHWVDHFIV